MRQLFAAKGFQGQDLERAVAVITSSRRHWIEMMLAEEHGLPLVSRSPVIAAVSTFAAFVLCGLVPLLPFVVGLQASLDLSAALTGLVFFMIGSLKSRWAMASWWRSGLETAVIGLTAAGVAYLVGYGLKGLIPA